MNDSRSNIRQVIGWATVAVTALPSGWRNVYRQEDGRLEESPCPAILLQENRGTTELWDELGSDGNTRVRQRFQAVDPPFDTRAVFAIVEDAYLDPVHVVVNYVGTIGPDQDAAELSEDDE